MRNNEIAMVGVPMDLGADRRGVDMGPSAIRYASVKEKLAGLGYRVKDLGNLVVPTPESMDAGENKLKYMREITAVSRELAETTDQVVQSGCFPLILGGDHSIAIGSIAGVARHHKRMGVIWFDAHGDLNTSKT